MYWLKRSWLLLAFALMPAAQSPRGGEPLTRDEARKLRELIRPHAGEDKWDDVAWRTNLWEARAEAAAKGRPILLWEMDGHPLGCT
jgi:hypothetical protein